MTHSEIEIKLRLGTGPAEARRLLEARGARLVSGREFEDNVLLDDGALSLMRRGALLRLRRCRPGRADGEAAAVSARLTLKELGAESSERYKIRDEVETGVESPDALEVVLHRLGYRTVYRYQKFRTVFEAATAAGALHVMLDETPIGLFLELEGSTGAIDEFAAKLGFGHEDYITLSYRGLQEQAYSGSGREPGDMVFEEA